VFIMIAVIIGGITASTRAIVPGAMFSFNIWAQIVHWVSNCCLCPRMHMSGMGSNDHRC
jgi:hypothetical protein